MAGNSFSNDACKASSMLLTSISNKLHPAAKAINPEYPPSVIKVAKPHHPPSRVSSASVAELRFATVLSEAGGATTTYRNENPISARAKRFRKKWLYAAACELSLDRIFLCFVSFHP
jgi:hypothetical protein